jgi:hypothetical protein
VQIHPGAAHSFLRPNLQSHEPNATATRLSWAPAIAFLEACLRAGQARH